MDVIYEVYLDVMAIRNLLSDVVILLAVDFFLQKNCGKVRIFCFACMDTVLNCCLFLLLPWGGYLFCVHGLLHPAILLFLFRERNLTEFIKEFVGSYIFSFFLGGIRQVLFLELGDTSAYETLLGFALFAISVLWCRKLLKERLRYCKVCLLFQNQILDTCALIDSGNLLRDPYTGKNVSLINKELFGLYFQKKPLVRLVPYQSLGCENGLLEVFTLETMVLFGTREFNIEKPVIGLADSKLFEGKPYQMIVNITELQQIK